jgi:hypothetical protein
MACQSGAYVKRASEVRPAYMAPSDNPEHYSMVCALLPLPLIMADGPKWCSFCNDFGSILILCMTCRVGICLWNWETNSGCVEWDPRIDADDFIYNCPFCAWWSNIATQVCVVRLCGAPI